jgi:hypothetical protein
MTIHMPTLLTLEDAAMANPGREHSADFAAGKLSVSALHWTDKFGVHNVNFSWKLNGHHIGHRQAARILSSRQ